MNNYQKWLSFDNLAGFRNTLKWNFVMGQMVWSIPCRENINLQYVLHRLGNFWLSIRIDIGLLPVSYRIPPSLYLWQCLCGTLIPVNANLLWCEEDVIMAFLSIIWSMVLTIDDPTRDVTMTNIQNPRFQFQCTDIYIMSCMDWLFLLLLLLYRG